MFATHCYDTRFQSTNSINFKFFSDLNFDPSLKCFKKLLRVKEGGVSGDRSDSARATPVKTDKAAGIFPF
jgi:hypothetical protein